MPPSKQHERMHGAQMDGQPENVMPPVPSLKVKGKVFPYSLPSVGPGADPGVQAVSPQVT